MPKQHLVTAFISLLLLLLVVIEEKSVKRHKSLLRRLLYILNSTEVRRTHMEGQRLFTSSWDHKFPLRFQFPIWLTDKPRFSEKSLNCQVKQVPKQKLGQKNKSLPQKCPHLLTLPKECLLVCIEHMPFESRVKRNVYFWTLERAVIPCPSLFFCFLTKHFPFS